MCPSTSVEDQKNPQPKEPHKEYVKIERDAEHLKPHTNTDLSTIVILLVVFVAVFVAFVCM